jgi:ParB/RepB/Spo0J family partition protein
VLLKDLVVSQYNVRDGKTSDEGIESLKDSIKEHRLISKIILRQGASGKYEIIAGQRRFRALSELHGEDHELLSEDYVIMSDLDDEKAYLMSITENQQRQDLSPIELNKAILKLNIWGYKDKEIAKVLNVTPHRLKRLATLGQDMNRIPEAAQQELHKPIESAKFNDSHWEKLKDVDNEEVIKDVVDYIIDKDTPPRDVPSIVKAVTKQFDKDNPLPSENPFVADDSDAPPADGPIEYVHKGEMKLEIHGDEKILKVIGKGTENEDETVPLEHYMEYLMHPEKFRCYVTFKLKIKPVD